MARARAEERAEITQAELVETTAQHAAHLASLIDEDKFCSTFGGSVADLPALLASKTVTLPLLMHIAPPGTPDPTPLLYNEAFYACAASSALGVACFAAAFRLPLTK